MIILNESKEFKERAFIRGINISSDFGGHSCKEKAYLERLVTAKVLEILTRPHNLRSLNRELNRGLKKAFKAEALRDKADEVLK